MFARLRASGLISKKRDLSAGRYTEWVGKPVGLREASST